MPESRLTQEQRAFVKQRAGGCCEYCFSQVAFCPDPFSIEHIVPRSKGGSNDLDNLAIACQGCNNSKYSHVCSIDRSSYWGVCTALSSSARSMAGSFCLE